MTFQDIIDFLLSLVRDEDAAAAFEQDPDATLAAAGLSDVTGQDIREARLQLADSGVVATSSAAASPGGSDPVGEIAFTTRNFSAAEAGPTFIDQSTTITVDDRDITVDDSETTIVNDSFNSDDDIVAIDNSVDNSIDNSVDNVTAIQDNDVVNNDNDVIDIVDVDVINEAPTEPEPTPEPADVPEAELDEPADPLADAAAV